MNYGRIVLDFETRSYADLVQVGVWNYALHPTTEIICACWKIYNAAGNLTTARGEWDMTKPREMPADLRDAAMAGAVWEAQNYSFELAIWTNVAVPKLGWCPIPPGQWRDLMAAACYFSMPAKVDVLSRALGRGGKNPEGKRLISKYSCLYNKNATTEIPPEDLRKFIDYCHDDVTEQDECSAFIGDLPDAELEVFQLDYKINMRGLYLDQAGIDMATRIVDERAAILTKRFNEITGLNPSQGAKLLVWFAERGLKLENMQADYLRDLVEEGVAPAGEVREALTIRLKINKASTKKLDAMARHRTPNGRALWQTRYHGAQTGRWTGGGLQPLNLNRGFEDVEPDQLVADIMHGSGAWLDCMYGDAMDAVSKASRHWIMAEPGCRILAGDFVSIEAVVLACMAGEEWKVEAFRQEKFIYGVMGCKIHNLDLALLDTQPTKKESKTWFKENYSTAAKDGKTGELAFGYQGGLGAWLNFDDSGRHSDARIEEIKTAWRDEHPMIVAMWKGLEDAAIDAIETGGFRAYREVGFQRVDSWLSMILPNGKRLWYFDPRLEVKMPRWHTPEVMHKVHEGEWQPNPCFTGDCRCRPRAQLTYMAVKEGQWRRVGTYGGKLTENAVQATSREFLIPSIKAVEKAKYPVILTVYDEVVCEVTNGHGSTEEFIDLLKNAPGRDWSNGWPIGVEAWCGQRYRK